MLKIRMLVNGHTQQQYDFEYGQRILESETIKGNLVVDDETRQLVKIHELREDGNYTVYPKIVGG